MKIFLFHETTVSFFLFHIFRKRSGRHDRFRRLRGIRHDWRRFWLGQGVIRESFGCRLRPLPFPHPEEGGRACGSTAWYARMLCGDHGVRAMTNAYARAWRTCVGKHDEGEPGGYCSPARLAAFESPSACLKFLFVSHLTLRDSFMNAEIAHTRVRARVEANALAA